MKEKNLVLLFTLILVVLGALFAYYSLVNSKFNFYSSEVIINNNAVTETLYFKPDKAYHTLFRTFSSSITTEDYSISNSILFDKVECSNGNPYFNTFNSRAFDGLTLRELDYLISYTEANEYGCSFGNELGFMQDSEYKVIGTYKLNPENIFQIGGKNYIKFIAYSRDNHKLLRERTNLKLSEDIVAKSFYLPKEDVILYVPYSGDLFGLNIKRQSNFVFDSRFLFYIMTIILAFIPGLGLLIIWLFYGRENIGENMPDQLSTYPNERKAWEVAAFFNPPFVATDQNFTAALMLDFYHRKIVDIKTKEGGMFSFSKDVLVKINDDKVSGLDAVEKYFLDTLKIMRNKVSDSGKKDEYFSISKSSRQFSIRFDILPINRKLLKVVKEKSKEFFSQLGETIFYVLLGISIPVCFIFGLFALLPFYFLSFIIVAIVSSKSAMLKKFKGNYYEEYLKWQGFKKWLSYSHSMRETGPRGIVLWEIYLVYATALGVAKQVLKELKQEKIINETQYNHYNSIYLGSTYFATVSGVGHSSSGSGGRFGGAGGGGIGGGGGGGR